MRKYDVVIIGGGLAGLTLSIQLAKKNLHVILFEKERYPFHKVCGEYIAMESWDYLEACGIPLSKMNLPRITSLNISSPSGNLLRHKLEPGGFGISRFSLDQLLAEEAIKAGVLVMQETKVNDVIWGGDQFTVTSSGGSYNARIVVGSFGKRSNLDVKFQRSFIQNKAKGLNNYIAVKYHVAADLPDDVIELHNFSNGYCGISKTDQERYCLCYLTTAENLNRSGNDIKRMEAEILMRNPYLNKYFQSFVSLYEEPVIISQVSFASKTQTEQHILMPGDSAGLITPLCGNGMSMAMHASKILVHKLELFFENKITRAELENQYTMEWKKHFSKRLIAGRIFQQLFGKEWVTNSVISLLKPFPFVVKELVSLTHGKPF